MFELDNSYGECYVFVFVNLIRMNQRIGIAVPIFLSLSPQDSFFLARTEASEILTIPEHQLYLEDWGKDSVKEFCNVDIY